MPDAYGELLDAAIHYLNGLKERGEKFLPGSFPLEQLSREHGPKAFSGGESGKGAKPPAPAASPDVSSLRETSLAAAPPRGESAPSPRRADRGESENIFARIEPLEPQPEAAAALPAEEKEAGLNQLRERALVCQLCPHLARSRKSVVFGEGDISSPLMFVGEAPGADEDQQGRPFVGRAGQLLTRIIETMGFTRDTVYIANILKCRPDTPGQSFGNRKPTPDEMKTCSPYLFSQIGLIQPKVIVALGATAAEGLFGRTVYITRMRGQFQEFRGIPVMPTYHPSYLLHNSALSEKRKIWEDMLKVLAKLGRPISEKQQNFFLKPDKTAS